MRRFFAAIVFLGVTSALLCSCSSESSGTIQPTTQQMKPGKRGGHGASHASGTPPVAPPAGAN